MIRLDHKKTVTTKKRFCNLTAKQLFFDNFSSNRPQVEQASMHFVTALPICNQDNNLLELSPSIKEQQQQFNQSARLPSYNRP